MEARTEPDGDTDKITHAVIGAAIEVHRHLGPGFLESVYEDALAVELELRGIDYRRQVPVSICYKGRPVGKGKMDILVENKVVIELKTVDTLLPLYQAQLLSYLKATGLGLGLLINFNNRVLRDGIKRVILSQQDCERPNPSNGAGIQKDRHL